MEIGRYYVDGEGFYKAVDKEEDCNNKSFVIMEAVMTNEHYVSYYAGIRFVESACDRRMAECTEEQFLKAKEKALKVIGELYQYNSDVFFPAWEAKREQQL